MELNTMGIKTVKTLIVLSMLFSLSDTYSKSYSDIRNLHTSLFNQLSNVGITQKDLNDSIVADHYVSKHNGVTHLVLKQSLNGIEVYQGDIQVNLDKYGNQLNIHNNFIANLSNKTNTSSPTIPADLAILNAADSVNINTIMPTYMLSTVSSLDKSAIYSGEGISLIDIPVKLILSLIHI